MSILNLKTMVYQYRLQLNNLEKCLQQLEELKKKEQTKFRQIQNEMNQYRFNEPWVDEILKEYRKESIFKILNTKMYKLNNIYTWIIENNINFEYILCYVCNKIQKYCDSLHVSPQEVIKDYTPEQIIFLYCDNHESTLINIINGLTLQ